MKSQFENSKLVYRKLKISDYKEFRKVFYSCFKKNVTLKFFKKRYFSDNYSFCYGAFESSKLIANVGMVSVQLNNVKKERIYSRHSSMVLQKYRGKGVFSNLLNKVKKKIIKKVNLIAMWPNKINFSNFSIDKKNIINKKYYLYETKYLKKTTKKTRNYSIDNIFKFKKYIKENNSYFLKNYIYYKKRYLTYKKSEYYINQFVYKKKLSFYILKRNQDISGINYVVLDHFGSLEIKSIHLKHLINEQNKLIILSQSKIKKNNFKFLSFLYFKIGYIKKNNYDLKRTFLFNKEIYLGDTDTFITYSK